MCVLKFVFLSYKTSSYLEYTYRNIWVKTFLPIILVFKCSMPLSFPFYRQSLNCQYYSGPSYLGVGNSSTMEGMRLPSGGCAPSMRSNSYATIASLKKFPPLQPSSPTREVSPFSSSLTLVQLVVWFGLVLSTSQSSGLKMLWHSYSSIYLFWN